MSSSLRRTGNSSRSARVAAATLSRARERLGLLQGINSAAWRPAHIRRILGPSLPTGVIVDVGANRGSFVSTCRSAGARGRIYAFEPQSELVPDIEQAGGPSTIVLPEALGREDAMTSVFRARVGDPKASILAPSSREESDVVLVAQRTLDSFMRSEGLERVDLLKIDAEGADIYILEGATEALATGSVRAVACEISWRSAAIGVFPGDVQDFLASAGFERFYRTTPYFGLLPLPSRIPNYEGGTSNLVALRGW